MTSTHDVLAGLVESTIARHEALYKHLHQNPELSMQEHETAAEVARRLESFGYEVQRIGGGVVGVVANGPGATVLFRADMDAIPVTEATGLPYASTKTVTDATGATVGVMHACAHDAHVTCGLGRRTPGTIATRLERYLHRAVRTRRGDSRGRALDGGGRVGAQGPETRRGDGAACAHVATRRPGGNRGRVYAVCWWVDQDHRSRQGMPWIGATPGRVPRRGRP